MFFVCVAVQRWEKKYKTNTKQKTAACDIISIKIPRKETNIKKVCKR